MPLVSKVNGWIKELGERNGERLKGQKGEEERHILYCKFIAGIKTIRCFKALL